MNTQSLTISKMIHGGYGLGQLDDGRIAMIRQTLAGEQVTFVVEEEKKKYLLGRMLTVLQQSESRIEAPCPYYGVCGGCDLQHAAYEEQLRIKRDVLIDLLNRQLFTLPEDVSCPVNPTLASPLTTGYRQRIRLRVRDGHDCGFRKFHSHDIVTIKRCLIAREEINDALHGLSRHQGFTRLLANCLELELLFNPSSGKVSALFHLSRKPRPADFGSAAELTAALCLLERVFFAAPQFPLAAASPAGCNSVMGITYQDADCELAPFTLSWEAGGFCQINLEQNRNLISIVSEFAALKHHETVLDLFCGSGNFSIPLAAAAGSLLGIEGQGGAIRSARANSATAGLVNTTFEKRPIHAACEELAKRGSTFDCLVIDPPRQGIPGLAGRLHSLCRSRLVYISCDPATLCRDLADLRSAGFTITRIQPVDMFPQTHHVETIVLLEKN